MVSFTCNACGQTVKKAKVEKHYQTECRDCTVLSCLDCGKDFHGDEYASHTSCISEAEKYQGKLYKDVNKGQPPKGEKKQQEWIEKVKEAASMHSTNPRLAGLLDRLLEYSNIPRKMKKFQNFVGNSLNVRDQKTLDELWSMFSGLQSKGEESAVAGPGGKQDERETSIIADTTGEVVEVEEGSKKKKKKHKKREDDVSESVEEDVHVVEESISKKKRKKEKNTVVVSTATTNGEPQSNNQLDIQLLSDSQLPVPDEGEPKKKKKSKKKKSLDGQEHVPDTAEQETTAQDTVRDNGVEDSINHWMLAMTDGGTVEKKKKRKHKCTEASEDTAATEEDIEETVMECVVVPRKKKKSKSKDVEEDIDQVVECMEADETVTVEKKKRKYKTPVDGPVDKKAKMQDDDVSTDSPKVKHKKKVKN